MSTARSLSTFDRSLRMRSESSPANSTPVGPPPTMTASDLQGRTLCSHAQDTGQLTVSMSAHVGGLERTYDDGVQQTHALHVLPTCTSAPTSHPRAIISSHVGMASRGSPSAGACQECWTPANSSGDGSGCSQRWRRHAAGACLWRAHSRSAPSTATMLCEATASGSAHVPRRLAFHTWTPAQHSSPHDNLFLKVHASHATQGRTQPYRSSMQAKSSSRHLAACSSAHTSTRRLSATRKHRVMHKVLLPCYGNRQTRGNAQAIRCGALT